MWAFRHIEALKIRAGLGLQVNGLKIRISDSMSYSTEELNNKVILSFKVLDVRMHCYLILSNVMGLYLRFW